MRPRRIYERWPLPPKQGNGLRAEKYHYEAIGVICSRFNVLETSFKRCVVDFIITEENDGFSFSESARDSTINHVIHSMSASQVEQVFKYASKKRFKSEPEKLNIFAEARSNFRVVRSNRNVVVHRHGRIRNTEIWTGRDIQHYGPQIDTGKLENKNIFLDYIKLRRVANDIFRQILLFKRARGAINYNNWDFSLTKKPFNLINETKSIYDILPELDDDNLFLDDYF